MPKRIFYIDLENTKSAGFEGIEELVEDDTVIVFYSENANTITVDAHEKLAICKAMVRFIKSNVGSGNALDFQLSSLLGFDINRCGDNTKYFIVSKDQGYSPLPKFWKAEAGASVSLVSNLKGAQTKKAATSTNKAATQTKKAAPSGKAKADTNKTASSSKTQKAASSSKAKADVNTKPMVTSELCKQVKELVKPLNLDSKEPATISTYVAKYKTKMGFNNALVKRYKSELAGQIYQAVKPLLADKK